MAKARLKRKATKQEPTLHVHRYVARVTCGKSEKFHYLNNREEVRAKARALKKGHVMEVFAAAHNFIGAFQR